MGPGKSAKGSVERPDIIGRNSHVQTVPFATEELDDDDGPSHDQHQDLPPAYEQARWPPSATAEASAPDDSRRSSSSAHEGDELMVSARRQEAARRAHSGGASGVAPGIDRHSSRGSSCRSVTSRTAAGRDALVDATGYRPNEPMRWYDDPAKWWEFEGKPGFFGSSRAGCLFSDRAGCCFSDRGGCFFSDRGGCCFSDRGGCCFSDTGGCCFGEEGGCCFNHASR